MARKGYIGNGRGVHETGTRKGYLGGGVGVHETTVVGGVTPEIVEVLPQKTVRHTGRH